VFSRYVACCVSFTGGWIVIYVTRCVACQGFVRVLLEIDWVFVCLNWLELNLIFACLKIFAYLTLLKATWIFAYPTRIATCAFSTALFCSRGLGCYVKPYIASYNDFMVLCICSSKGYYFFICFDSRYSRCVVSIK